MEQLQLKLQRLSGVEIELKRLAGVLGYQLPPGGELRPADVIYVDHSSWLRTLLIYVGGAAVERNQPVVDAEGLVGRVILVAPPYAKVQLLTDRAAAVGAMIRRTRRQGVVRSGPDGLKLDFLPLQADVRVGDRVVTSGTDRIDRQASRWDVVSDAPGDEAVLRRPPRAGVDFSVLDQVYGLSRPPVPDALTEARPGAID